MTYEEAIEKYEKLIYHVMGKYKIQGFELEDMFNIGRYNLWVCCKTFDESKGYAFSTYLVKSLQNECHKMYLHSQRAKRSKDRENKSLYDGTPSPYGDSSLGVGGNITTYTDSAAGGTALATGVKVTNSRIGLDIEGNTIENLVEIASSLNKKTGVVTSDEVVGATPSSFLAHVPARYEAYNIFFLASLFKGLW